MESPRLDEEKEAALDDSRVADGGLGSGGTIRDDGGRSAGRFDLEGNALAASNPQELEVGKSGAVRPVEVGVRGERRSRGTGAGRPRKLADGQSRGRPRLDA